MTPRQRIALRRRCRARRVTPPCLRNSNGVSVHGIETCAGDGMCSIPCPIGINTGALIKEFRARENSPAAEWVALRLASTGKRSNLWRA